MGYTLIIALAAYLYFIFYMFYVLYKKVTAFRTSILFTGMVLVSVLLYVTIR